MFQGEKDVIKVSLCVLGGCDQSLSLCFSVKRVWSKFVIVFQGEEDVIKAVKAAVRCGYRHIDCAAIYRNERAVGHALKELIVEGIIQREDIFVVSKVSCWSI